MRFCVHEAAFQAGSLRNNFFNSLNKISAGQDICYVLPNDKSDTLCGHLFVNVLNYR